MGNLVEGDNVAGAFAVIDAVSVSQPPLGVAYRLLPSEWQRAEVATVRADDDLLFDSCWHQS
jgi:hypothetical protein